MKINCIPLKCTRLHSNACSLNYFCSMGEKGTRVDQSDEILIIKYFYLVRVRIRVRQKNMYDIYNLIIKKNHLLPAVDQFPGVLDKSVLLKCSEL